MKDVIWTDAPVAMVGKNYPGGGPVTAVGKQIPLVDGDYTSMAILSKEAVDARIITGTAVLVGGTLLVANTTITANSRIFLTSQVNGGTPGFLRVSARVPGTSFTILSSSGTDTSTVGFLIIEPA